jgi:hypothetical protein
MRIVVMIVLGFALFWLWFFFGARDNCPRCGNSLVDYYDNDSGIAHSSPRRTSCACGWHE